MERACARLKDFGILHWSSDVVGMCCFLHIPAFCVGGIDMESHLDRFILSIHWIYTCGSVEGLRCAGWSWARQRSNEVHQKEVRRDDTPSNAACIFLCTSY